MRRAPCSRLQVQLTQQEQSRSHGASNTIRLEARDNAARAASVLLLYPFGHIIPLTDTCLQVHHPSSDPLQSHSKVGPCLSPVTSGTQIHANCPSVRG